MNERTFDKYSFLSKMLWKFTYPMFKKLASSTKTEWDDEMIEFINKVMKSEITFDDINVLK